MSSEWVCMMPGRVRAGRVSRLPGSMIRTVSLSAVPAHAVMMRRWGAIRLRLWGGGPDG
ncbi:MAG: hypothetical protein PHX89_08640 [bacterium]|nr:hypothetical protein [bacterium]